MVPHIIILGAEISTLGRSGEFMYMDIDKCMRKAFDFADHLIENQS